MSFNKVILKNLKGNIRYYLSYFLCIVCSISFFFMLVNLINDYNLKTAFGHSGAFTLLVIIPLFVLGVFSIIFISYVNKTLVNQMGKELGLFLALGMDRKKITKIVLVQNIAIGLSATGVGLILGSVFSRLFFTIVIKIMDVSNVPFGLHVKSYLYTTIMFFIIFFYILVRSLSMAKKFGAIDLMKKDRVKEDIRFKKPIWGIFGLVLIIGSTIFFFKYVHSEIEWLSKLAFWGYVLVSLVGVSLIISQSYNLLAFISNRSKETWYKNLLFNTNFRYRINSNKKFILALTMTYFVIFDLGVMVYHEYGRIEMVTKERNDYDFQYLDVRDNKIDEKILRETIEKQGVSVKNKNTLEILELAEDKNPVIFMNDENFNKVFDRNIKVDNNNSFVLRHEVSNQSINKDITVRSVKEYNEKFEKYSLGKSYEFKVTGVEKVGGIGNHDYIFCIGDIFVISKHDFDEISKEEESKSLGKIYYYNFSNWKDGYKVEKGLRDLPQNFFNAEVKGKGLDKISKAFSTLGKIKDDKSQHGLMLFLFVFICFIFLMAAGSLIYFRYFSEIDNEKKRYKKLRGVGVTFKEIKGMIGKDMIFMFFVPCIIGFCISAIRSYGVYGVSQRKVLLTSEVKVVVICFALQTIYYFISKRKVYNEVVSYLK